MECLISRENLQNLVKEYEWLHSQFANTLSHFQFKHKSQNILSIEPWTSSWGSYSSRMLIISYHIQTCCSVISDSLRHHGLKHARLPYPSLLPGVCSISCPLGRCYNPTISSSTLPTFSSCPQSFSTWGSFPVSQLFTSSRQSIRASASSSVLPMIIRGWFPLGLTYLISFLWKGLSRVFSSTTVWKHQFFSSTFFWSNSHIWTGLVEKR